MNGRRLPLMSRTLTPSALNLASSPAIASSTRASCVPAMLPRMPPWASVPRAAATSSKDCPAIWACGPT